MVIARHARRLASTDERRALVEQIERAHASRIAARAALTPAVSAPVGSADSNEVSPDIVVNAMIELSPFLRECAKQADAGDLVVHAHLTLTGDPDIGTLVDAGQLLDAAEHPIAAKLDACVRSTLQDSRAAADRRWRYARVHVHAAVRERQS